MEKAMFEMSADTVALLELFRQAEIGDVVSYDDMSKKIGRNVRKYSYGSIATARKQLLAEGILFDTVRDVGIKRLTDSEGLQVAESDIAKTRRHVKRSDKKLALGISFENLSEPEKHRHNAFRAIFGVIRLFSKDSAVNRVSRQITATQQQLPPAKTLELFRGNGS